MTKFKKTILHCGLLVASFAATLTDLSASLDHGHVRARTRWFTQAPGEGIESNAEAEAEVEEKPIVEETVEITQEVEVAAPVEVAETAEDQRVGGQHSAHRRVGKINLGFGSWSWKKKEKDKFKMNRSGYLSYAPPSPLRFSDEEKINKRPPSPALPEFNVLGDEYSPYLIETPLSEDEMGLDYMNEIVIDLDTHSVLSGVIDTSTLDRDEKVEHFNLDENKTTVLRPEEVLIFFETDGVHTETNAIIPFSPAQPMSEGVKSSARLIEK